MSAQCPENSQPQYDQQRGHPKQSLCKPAQHRTFEILGLLSGQQRNRAGGVDVGVGVTVSVIVIVIVALSVIVSATERVIMRMT
jgi:hypothetical protein